MNRLRFVLLIACCAMLVARASETARQPRVELSGGVGISVMRIMNSSVATFLNAQPTPYLNGAWLEDFTGSLNAAAHITDRLTINTGIGGRIWSPAQTKVDIMDLRGRRESAWVSVAAAHIVIGRIERPYFDVDVGFIGFNSNPDSKSFGQYLYKGGCYPGYVFSGSDAAKLTGVKLHSSYFEVLEHTGIVNLEMEYPYFDVSLGYVPVLHIGAFLDIGAGIVAYRLIPADEDRTHPTGLGAASYVDDESGERVYYSNSGTKLMARFSFDPKPLLNTARLGEPDLKLYAEAGVMGVRNYDDIQVGSQMRGYSDLRRRIPVMVGFNLPVFRLLDHLTVEFEYYRLPHVNNAYFNGNPFPPPPDREPGFDPAQDDFRWAVVTKRTLFERVWISARAASDHYRRQNSWGWPDAEEMLRGTDEWYGAVSMGVGF